MRVMTNAIRTSAVVPGLLAPAARAEGDGRLTGLWKLVSYEVEIRSSGE